MTEQKTPHWVPNGRAKRPPPMRPPTPRRDELITKQVAIDVIGWAVKSASEELRAAKDKVRKRIDKGIADGDLLPSPKGLLKFGHVVAWARPKWPTLFTAMPSASEELVDSASIADDTLETLAIPGALHACQAALTAALERLLEMERQQAASEADLAAARRLADKASARSVTARRNGGTRRSDR